jgi:phage-related protein (TIGR01555 family)
MAGKKIAESKLSSNFDGWENLWTGVGIENRDRRVSTTFTARNILSEGELTQLYSDDGLARRIVDKYVEEMMKKGFRVEGDPGDLVKATLEDIEAFPALEELLTWARLHGGAVSVVRIDDGGTLDTPVNEAQIRTIEAIDTYDRWQVQVNRPLDLYTDINNPKYGKVQFYNIQPFDGTASFRVHESRCIVMDGQKIPKRLRLLNQGWGISILQSCFEKLRRLDNIYGNVESITEDFVTTTVTMKNLMELIAAKKEAVVKRRLALMDMSRHTMNTVLLDELETFNKSASTVSGLPEVVDRFVSALVAVTGMPARVLLGQQGGGLNNNGDGETRDWYDSIASEQVRKYRPALEKLVRYIFLAKKGYFKGVEPKQWFIEFTPLYQPTEKEVAEVYKINSDADCAYVNAGVLDEVEVALSRFGETKYGQTITLATLKREPATEDEDASLDEEK